ncbi:MAG TPA: hypothetical protein VLK65_24860 [Vicinamibacteria bacterium]|nr:hypothetical protein [Vicinamibacteria bacterium]
MPDETYRRDMKLIVFAWGLLGITGGAASAESQGYVVQRIAVSKGANDVSGVRDGIVLSRPFNSRCERVDRVPGVTRSEAFPVSGVAGGELVLEVAVASCPSGPEDSPRSTCSWTIETDLPSDPSCRSFDLDRIEGEGQFDGERGEVVLRLPQKTGIYALTLACDVESSDGTTTHESIKRRLYTTLREPLFLVSPPQVDWYERAACWGGGFEADAAESDVLESLLGGLYRYGQDHWRYGYAKKLDTKGSYAFPQGAVQYRVEGVEEPIYCWSAGCKCSWRQLVSSQSTCNFADCYVFSDVLQHMAATLGIGGLIGCAECNIDGMDGQGFATPPSAQSLDSAFTGNVSCRGGQASCPSYVFGSHSLLWRNGTYFDSTFNRTYAAPGDAIGMNIKAQAGKERMHETIFFDNPAVMFYEESQYGGWTYYNYPTGLMALTTPGGAQGEREVAFTGDASFEKADSDFPDIYDTLRAEVEIEILVAGTYTVYGRLVKDGKVVASKPDWWSVNKSSGTVFGRPGKHRVEIDFSGEQVFRSGVNGPYELHAHFESGDSEPLVVSTPAFAFVDFGESSALIDSIHYEWMPSSVSEGQYDLKMDVAIEVRERGSYLLQTNLSQNGRTLANLGVPCQKGSCPLPVLPTSDLQGFNRSEPLEATFELFGGADVTTLDAEQRSLSGVLSSSR